MDVMVVCDTGVSATVSTTCKACSNGRTGSSGSTFGSATGRRGRWRVFGFHRIAVRDCVERNHVSKVHVYPTMSSSPACTRSRWRGHVHYVELDQFIGQNYLVTVHGPLNPAVDPGVAIIDTENVLQPDRGEAPADRSPVRAVPMDRVLLDPARVDLVASLAKESGRLEQRVMLGEDHEDPEEFLEELFQAWYVLLAVRTMATHSSATYGRWRGWSASSRDAAQPLLADIADQFEVVQTMADGQRDFLHGVIEFYQTRTSTHLTLAAEKRRPRGAAKRRHAKDHRLGRHRRVYRPP